MGFNVRLSLTNPVTNSTEVIERLNLSGSDLTETMDEIPECGVVWGTSTSKLGYEPKGYPDYLVSTGFLAKGNLLYNWTQLS